MVRLAELPLAIKEPEPDLEISRVFRLPRPVLLAEISAPRAREFLRQVQEAHIELDRSEFGHAYSRLTTLFIPLTDWLIACWDYLLTVEGLRFIERNPSQRAFLRGHYRALLLEDYQRLVFREFKKLVLEVDPEHFTPQRARTELWPRIRRAFVSLEHPRDTRQRTLTAYSYLRCVPYSFLNHYHEIRVKDILKTLPQREQDAVRLYFLHFFTPETIASQNKTSLRHFTFYLERGLKQLEQQDFLSYRLLLQISRY